MNPKTIFFCGNKSPYGIAHFTAIIDQFDVKVVIVGTDKRWKIFREALCGKTYYSTKTHHDYLKSLLNLLKYISPYHILRLLNARYIKNTTSINIKKALKDTSIELWYVFDVNSEETLNKLKALSPDLFISAAYPQIFSKELLSIPNRGAVNFHPSLLPKFRGAHPHFWQIIKGTKLGGLTAHYMTEEIDRGDIICQISFPIKDCTYSDLYKLMVDHTPKLVSKVRKYFVNEQDIAIPQCNEDATYFRNNRDLHSRIFWEIHDSNEIHNIIKTGTAFCFFRGRRVSFISSYITKTNRNLTNEVRVENGAIIDIGKGSISIKTLDGCINITTFIDKYKKLSHMEWAKKRKIYIGEKFN